MLQTVLSLQNGKKTLLMVGAKNKKLQDSTSIMPAISLDATIVMFETAGDENDKKCAIRMQFTGTDGLAHLLSPQASRTAV
jgi:hypothetical protein